MKKIMKENIAITLKYTGIEVNDGTMSIDDFLPVIQGFASAYGKVSSYKNFDYQHNLRIIGIKKGSADILLQARDIINNNANQIQAIGVVGSGVAFTVGLILKVISLTKHVKKKPFTNKISNNNQTIIVTNCDKVSIEYTLDVFNIFNEGLIAPDLNKIVRPLDEGRIDSSEIITKYDNKEEKEIIIFEEKKYFDTSIAPATSTKEAWITGKFNSLTKSTNRGYFFLTDGTRVSYEIKAENPEVLYPHFIYKGLVKVKAVVQLDENLKPTQIDIYDVQRLQQALYEKKDEK